MLGKIRKFVFILTAALFMAVSFVGCNGGSSENESSEQQKTYVLNQPVLELAVGETFDLEVLNLENAQIEWTSSQNDIATVNEKGEVTAHAPGTATITAKFNGESLTCTVHTDVVLVPAYVLEIVNVEKTNDTYAIRLMKGSSFTFEIALKGTEETVSATAVSNESGKVSANGLTVSAVDVTETAVITISCEYQSKTYQTQCLVVVEEVSQ